jgi:hypothetical protein
MACSIIKATASRPKTTLVWPRESYVWSTIPTCSSSLNLYTKPPSTMPPLEIFAVHLAVHIPQSLTQTPTMNYPHTFLAGTDSHVFSLSSQQSRPAPPHYTCTPSPCDRRKLIKFPLNRSKYLLFTPTMNYPQTFSAGTRYSNFGRGRFRNLQGIPSIGVWSPSTTSLGDRVARS